MNNKGVTLIEMIVAILILSISSITIAAGFNGVIPVSYTHLDVYKRQVQNYLLR